MPKNGAVQNVGGASLPCVPGVQGVLIACVEHDEPRRRSEEVAQVGTLALSRNSSGS